MTEKTRISQYVVKEMISFFERFQEIPVEDRQALEKAWQNRPDAANNYARAGVFTYSNYSWKIDCLKAIQARLEKESARVAKAQAQAVRTRY